MMATDTAAFLAIHVPSSAAIGDLMFQNNEPLLGKVLSKAKSGFNLHVGTFLANGVFFKTCKNDFVFTC